MFNSNVDGWKKHPKPKDYSGLEFFEKDRSEDKHLNFAKITIIKVWIQQWILKDNGSQVHDRNPVLQPADVLGSGSFYPEPDTRSTLVP